MQFKPGKLTDPLKPYRKERSRPRRQNCQIDVEHQVRLYAKWAKGQGLKTIHIYPAYTRGNARRAYDKLLKCDLSPNTRLVDVDPEDWK